MIYIRQLDSLLSSKYQEEQIELDVKNEAMTAELNTTKQPVTDAKKWVKLIRQYGSIPESYFMDMGRECESCGYSSTQEQSAQLMEPVEINSG